MSDCISKDEILSPDDYGFLYGQLECNKIPADIYDKIMEGDEFTEEEERRIKDIIEKEKAKIQEERKKGIKECWCDSCEYCEGYLHKTRKSFICNHPDYEYIRKLPLPVRSRNLFVKHLKIGYSETRNVDRHWWQNIMNFSILQDHENMMVHT